MKTLITAFLLLLSSIYTLSAQDLISKVPATASMVIKYSGENFSNLVPVKKIDSYNFIKTKFLKLLKIDTMTSIENTGINFEKDAFQYVSIEDSSMNFVSLFYLKNISQFLTLIKANYYSDVKPELKNGYAFVKISANTYLGWNQETAIFVVANYHNPQGYYDYPVTDAPTAMADSASIIADSIVASTQDFKMEEPAIDTASVPQKNNTIKKPKIVAPKHRAITPHKKVTGAVKKGHGTPIKKPKKVQKKPITDEEVKPEEAVPDPKIILEDSLRQAKVNLWRHHVDSVTEAVQMKIADSIINISFNSPTPSIETEVSYKKVIEPAANISLWLNNDILISKYWSSFYSQLTYSYRRPDINYSIPDSKDGLRSGVNIYFDKDKIRMQSKTFTANEKMDKLSKSVYESRQNTSITDFINPDNIGYVSVSVNSEAIQHYNYKIIKQYLSSYSFTREYADMIDVYIDLLEIIIDEKGISELAPGNYLFVLHDMKTVPVTYIDYTYDENFKSKKVSKTKKELSPNFTFIMETKREDFMQRVLNLPLKYAKKGNFNYMDRGGYYELAFDTGKYSISNIYFMVRDGKCIVTTSKESIDIALNNARPYTLDKETKKSILNNNYSLKLDSKKLLREIYPEISSEMNKKINTFCQENIGDLKMESGMKNDQMESTTTLDFTGNHSNGLEFIFDLIEGINNIIVQDKLDNQKMND